MTSVAMLTSRQRERLGRRVMYGLVAMMIAAAVLHLRRGEQTYANFWGAHVFAPFAIVVGVLFLAALVIRGRSRP